MILPDGTIISTHQTAIDTATAGPVTEQFAQWGLRVGQVRDIIYPKDKRSRSKKFIEYDVEVQHRDSFGRTASIYYPHCYLSSMFGGHGDKLHFTHRFASKTSAEGVGEGSKVIIGCINGDRQQAVILGGLRDTGDAPDENLGHTLFYEFNGIRALVNKDGEFSVQFNGATKYNGKLQDDADPEASGTFVKFTKTGNLALVHGSTILELLREENGWNMEGEGIVSVKSTADSLDLSGSKQVNIYATGAGAHLRMGAKGHISLESSAGVHIGADEAIATEHLLLGDTWAQQMTTLCSTMTTALATASAGLTAAAGFLPTVPASAAPGLAAAAAGLMTAISAFTTFQSQLIRMLSKKNTCD